MTLTEVFVAAFLAWLIAFAPRAKLASWTWHHHLAAAAILYPALRILINFIEIAPSIPRFEAPPPLTVEQIESIAPRILSRHLLVPLAGLVAVAALGGARVARGMARPAMKGLRAWWRDLSLGVAIAPLVIGAEGLALLLLFIVGDPTGDESRRWRNLGLFNAILLSVVPAFAEELYYRGLLQTAAERALPLARPAWPAILIQGLVFALAHAGFANVSHMLGPLIFGLAMGYLRSTVGLAACMVCHAAVNLFYFSFYAGAGAETMLLATTAVLAVVGLVLLVRERRTLRRLARAGPERGMNVQP